MHNWEVLVQFSVNGGGKQLFGDGFAFWYTKDRNELGQSDNDLQYLLIDCPQDQFLVTRTSSRA